MIAALLKFACIAVYAAAVLHLFMPLSHGRELQWFALVLLAAHLLELVLFYRQVRKYPGSLATSIVLTLLFGVLHWWPLSRQKH